MLKEKFDIQGMTCSSCSAHVERAVKKIDGIHSVNVNLLTNSMVVAYDEKQINTSNIIKAVIDAGYNANISNVNKKENKNDEIKNMKKRLITSFIFLIPLMFIAMHQMIFNVLNIDIPKILKEIFVGVDNAIIFAFVQLILLIPIIFVNRNYFKVGLKRLFNKSPNMDSLIAIGSGASIIYSLFATVMIVIGWHNSNFLIVEKYSKELYFESAGTILTLITLGKYLEAKSKGKTTDAISKLVNLTPKTAIVLKNGKEEIILTEEIDIDDEVIIKPGTSIPVDGIIVSGNSDIDQAAITGESLPVHKEVGDEVVSGSINKYGVLRIKAIKTGDNTTLAQIIKLVEEASNSKAPISRLADKVSGIFVPIVILISVIVTIIWLLLGYSFEFALSIGIAILVISCPCALGLATPVAIMVGTGKGAENGILIKSAESLELLHSINTVVLDKTGTITEGNLKVTDIITELEETEFIKIIMSLEKSSEHLLAEAIVKFANEKNIESFDITEFEAVSGRGVKAKINNNIYYGGNISFMKENNIELCEFDQKAIELLNKGKTCLYFATDTKVFGIVGISDVLKDTSKEAIDLLKEEKVEVIMLTGDNEIVAKNVGNELKLNKIIADVLPAEKEKEIQKLKKEGKKVAFVGDGINDSPALVSADVGIAIGSGTDIAFDSADIVLMKNDLLDVVTAIKLSKATINNIKLNLFWAFFYNTIGIPIAAGVLYPTFGLKLNPMIGAAAMSLSSVCVVTNALRLRKFKIEKKEKIIMNEKCIEIEGMMCNHCKMSVEKVLNTIKGVLNVEVSLENKTAIIKYNEEIKDEAIVKVIEGEGFKVLNIK